MFKGGLKRFKQSLKGFEGGGDPTNLWGLGAGRAVSRGLERMEGV